MDSLFLNIFIDYIKDTNTIVNWLEKHPQSVSIINTMIATLIPCICFREIFLFIIKPYIELRNKRIEAQTAFYPKLRLNISILRDLLERYNRLSVSGNKGNIYSIQYCEEVLYSYCAFEGIEDDELMQYQNAAEELRNIIETTNTNVPPKNCKKEKWEECQKEIVLLCMLIESKYRGTNVEVIDNLPEPNKEPPHITACKKLIDSMEYLTRDFTKNPDL